MANVTEKIKKRWELAFLHEILNNWIFQNDLNNFDCYSSDWKL
jgi:hypothetical protein